MRAPIWAPVVGMIAVVAITTALTIACSPAQPNVKTYRLRNSGADWHIAGRDAVLVDLEPRYPEFFEVILDPAQMHDPPILELREDIEADGDGRERYDALNAVAIAYFELNSRAQRGLEDETAGANYFANSFRATKLLSIPWRAYADIESAGLRDAILDFYDDIARGEKRDAKTTAPRITGLVMTLEKKESEPTRLARIREMAARLHALEAALR